MKVLFITSADLLKMYNNGGEQVCRSNIEILKKIYGEDNIYYLFFSENTNIVQDKYFVFPRLRKWKAALAELLWSKMYFPWNEKKIISCIENISPDIIFFDGILVGNIMPKIKKNIYTIVFEHNCEKKYYNLKMKHEGIIYAIEYWAISHCEKLAVSNCTALVCISERDQRDIFKYYNRKADALLPVSFENSFKKNKIQPNYKKELLFIGSNFGPNLEGILWFVDNVMSELRDFKLYIVGKNFENEKEKLKRLNVEVIGTVNSMEKYYYSFPVMVMPIFYGSGMKVKTAEAMMYGKTILATDEALEGYDVEDIDGIFRCNTKDDFINTIRSIFTENLSQFRQSVYNLYLEKYSREKTYDILKSIMPSEDKKDE